MAVQLGQPVRLGGQGRASLCSMKIIFLLLLDTTFLFSCAGSSLKGDEQQETFVSGASGVEMFRGQEND